MADLSASTTRRGGEDLPEHGLNSDDLAEIRQTWDAEESEVEEFVANESKGRRQNLSSLISGNASVSSSHGIPTYSLYTVQVAKSICLFVCFFGLGISVAILGPTLIELACQAQTELAEMSFVFTARAIGYLIGSIVGGWLFDKYNGHLVLSLSCVWAAVMMWALPYVTSLIGLLLVVVFMGLALGSVDTGGNVLLLNTWGKKSRPYMQALHFVFALGAFVAPLIVQPFLEDGITSPNIPTNASNDTSSTTSSISDSPVCSNHTGENPMPVTWAFWLGSIPLVATGVGFMAFVVVRACHVQSIQTQNEETSKTNEGSLTYKVVILSLFSAFLLLYVGLEDAFGGYIFTFGVKSRPKLSDDKAAFLTSAFWGSFALARLVSVPLARYMRPSKMICIDMVGCFIGSAVLVSQFAHGQCDRSDPTKLWIGTIILGVSMASIFPSALNFAEYFVTVSGKIASVLLVASSSGGMLVPLAVGHTIVESSVGPCSLMACSVIISVLTFVIFWLIKGAGRYFKRHGDGFVGMRYQAKKKRAEEESKRQPDEVLQLLEENNERFNGSQERET
ncbi:sodium-dependent glucose transporter 1A-like [Stylophora pistillata]|uniref:Sodium-dependent glucose transporter 1 n=1 Tax=Stylophora pistillata TaxID=50429 RepID=A0A2B4S7Q3_STYPI|nr:sodium-dependent glucose transporter 1A-like [Stylophora pistillata]PFX24485.1 Sodium-dependent glucose transporter 1 [Stylophora pistillata]